MCSYWRSYCVMCKVTWILRFRCTVLSHVTFMFIFFHHKLQNIFFYSCTNRSLLDNVLRCHVVLPILLRSTVYYTSNGTLSWEPKLARHDEKPHTRSKLFLIHKFGVSSYALSLQFIFRFASDLLLFYQFIILAEIVQTTIEISKIKYRLLRRSQNHTSGQSKIFHVDIYTWICSHPKRLFCTIKRPNHVTPSPDFII